MKLKVVKNIEEYFNVIEDIRKERKVNWFRGVSKASHRLTPSLYREKAIVGLDHSGKSFGGDILRKSSAIIKDDLFFLEDFKRMYNTLNPESVNFNLMDYLYIMQHYDIPTRLLDFSLCEKVALYFAVCSSLDKNSNMSYKDEIESFLENGHELGLTDNGAAVYCIEPEELNRKSSVFVIRNNQNPIFDFKDITLEKLRKIDTPICIKTNNTDKRIIAQKGTFMFFGYQYPSLDYYDDFQDNITKIFIPNTFRYTIKKELEEEFSISYLTIYPDIKGVALKITDEINKKYMRDCRKVFG